MEHLTDEEYVRFLLEGLDDPKPTTVAAAEPTAQLDVSTGSHGPKRFQTSRVPVVSRVPVRNHAGARGSVLPEVPVHEKVLPQLPAWTIVKRWNRPREWTQ